MCFPRSSSAVYALRKTKLRKPSRVSKYLSKREIKLLSNCNCSSSKINFTWNFSLDTGHTRQFSRESQRIIRPRLLGNYLCLHGLFNLLDAVSREDVWLQICWISCIGVTNDGWAYSLWFVWTSKRSSHFAQQISFEGHEVDSTCSRCSQCCTVVNSILSSSFQSKT
jgi:hypothetical protein